MRLQLIFIVVALLLPASLVRAQDAEPGEGEAAARLLVYSDDDATQVVTSILDAKAAVANRVQVGAHVLVDVVSSASVDVMSAATKRWEENRVEFGARGTFEVSNIDVSLGFIRSQENDWLSHSVALGGQKELFEKNTVVSAVYSLGLNKVGRASDPNFEQSIDTHTAEFGVSQLIDKKTRIGGAYTAQVLSGYLSSPYRYAIALDGTRGPERHPDSRIRHSISGSAVRSLNNYVSGRAAYRFYLDDWGIRSHTASIRVSIEPHERLQIGLEGRGYLQDQADFYREVYETSYRYMSSDRELSKYWDIGAFADAHLTVGPVIADAKVGIIHYKFDNFPALKERNALVAGGGAKVAW